MKDVVFNTANFVARFSGYKFSLSQWMQQDQLTRQRTDEKQWAAICGEIAAAGYRAVEIWVAHVDPAGMTDARAKAYRKILEDHGLRAVALAGAMTDETVRVCGQLGLAACNGGLWGSDLATVRRLTAATGIHYHFENHPETSAEEIVAAIEGGGERIGVAVDTGWLGTKGADGPAVIRQLGALVRHVHLKDVAAAGGHHTVPLGTGVADIVGVLGALREMGYAGWLSWEDEPEERNPMLIAKEMREWIERHAGGAAAAR